MSRWRSAGWSVLILPVILLPGAACGQVANGFDLSGALVPIREILGGGPPRDGIPALTDPPRVRRGAADVWLKPDDRVLGVARGEEAMAYPVKILNRHEIVNDRVGGQAVLITYCPLCGTGVVFQGEFDGKRALFGVSGLLYNSDVLLYERDTLSLFSQMLFKGITGPLRGRELRIVPSTATSWMAWSSRHPETDVLSRQLPFGMDYDSDPYLFYRRSGNLMFPVRGADRSRPSKEWAFLIHGKKTNLIVAEKTLKRATGRTAPERFALPQGLRLVYDSRARELQARDREESDLTVIQGYWFALTAFHPSAREISSQDLQTEEDRQEDEQGQDNRSSPDTGPR
ncbi:MAG: DUF3179 domain-containing protein [Acidobacteriota bacterium]